MSARRCTAEGCDRPHKGRGLCDMHIQRERRTGTTASPVRSLADRFWAKVAKAGPGDCWLWTGATNEHGYGVMRPEGERSGPTVKAHRVSAELAGMKVDGLYVLHACDNRLCVNPAHLRPGTAKENSDDMMRRGRGRGQFRPKPSRPVWSDADLGISAVLALTPEEVAALTRPERERRVVALVAESHGILDLALSEGVGPKHEAAATVGMFSGGNDSTVLAHMMLERLTHLAHANTGIGVEETRQFVRDTCAAWAKPLIERAAPREEDSYRALVLAHGFPGPGHHFKMYQRLKERAFDQVRRELVANGRRQRVMFVAGRRRTESDRRADVPALTRDRSIVWSSPMIHWTALDLATYRLIAARNGEQVPVNETSDLLHMSGECLCGAFATRGELDEISMWRPLAAAHIRALEAEIADRPDIPEHRKRWGWGAYHRETGSKTPRTGLLCGSCTTRWEQDAIEDGAAA